MDRIRNFCFHQETFKLHDIHVERDDDDEFDPDEFDGYIVITCNIGKSYRIDYSPEAYDNLSIMPVGTPVVVDYYCDLPMTLTIGGQDYSIPYGWECVGLLSTFVAISLLCRK